MKLLFLTSGRHVPSTRFRVLQLVPHLRAAGHPCTVLHSFPPKYDYFRWMGFRPSQRLKRAVRFLHLLQAHCVNYDAVILERELFHDSTWDLEERLRKTVRTLVLDVDDAVFLNFPDKFPHLVRMADLVFAGNDNLRSWVEQYNARIVVMPTCVDTDRYCPSPPHATHRTRPVVGWIGTAGGLAYLQAIAPALRAVANRLPFELRIITGTDGVVEERDWDGVDVRRIVWSAATEARDVAHLDIGLMPLFDDDWSRYKCGFKLLQYMSCGIPGIASPVGVNSHIVDHGTNGLLASTLTEWESALEQLLSDIDLRRHLGVAARKTVIKRYSINANLPRWIAAVEQTVRRST